MKTSVCKGIPVALLYVVLELCYAYVLTTLTHNATQVRTCTYVALLVSKPILEAHNIQ